MFSRGGGDNFAVKIQQEGKSIITVSLFCSNGSATSGDMTENRFCKDQIATENAIFSIKINTNSPFTLKQICLVF